jgi:hypothetical protein
MPDKTLTVNVPLSNDRFTSLVDFAVEHNITAEQLASQIVQQWVKTLPSNIKNVYQKTD